MIRILKQKPHLGDTRYKVKFAWFPKRIGSTGITIVWLERYMSLQRYLQVTNYIGNGMACTEYIKNQWVEIKTSLLKK